MAARWATLMKQPEHSLDPTKPLVARWGFPRSLAALVGVAGAAFCLAIGAIGLFAADFRSEAFNAALALGISVVSGVAGLLAIELSRGKVWEAWSSIVAMGVRMLLTLLLLTGLLTLAKGLVRISFLLYVIFFYAVILSFETFHSLRGLNRGSAAANTARTGTSRVRARGDQFGDLEVSSQKKGEAEASRKWD
jgi:hypothetical protein